MNQSAAIAESRLDLLVQEMHFRNIAATMKHIDAFDYAAACETDSGANRACRRIVESGLCWRDAHARRPS